MRAFKVFLNGKLLCLAGVGERGVLSVIINWVGRERLLGLHVGGLVVPQLEHVNWRDKRLRVGDEIRVRIVEAINVDAPRRRYRYDPNDDIRMQKRYVRELAKKFGWKIQISSKHAKT